MGFTGVLVRSVFSKNRSVGSHEIKVKRNGAENRRWVSVRSYLCGDEFNSVVAEEDSASVKSSEVTVTQSIEEDLTDKGDTKSEETVENVTQERTNSSLNEEEAAILIQSAYRSFLLRRQNEELRSKTGKEFNLATESPDRKSMSTSIEVQTGQSTDVLSVEGEKMSICHRIQRRTRTQVIKQKEDWDDSTVSSYVSKMRMQNRMEATTRRERALAYAFSQQLRICSKRKLTKHNSMEPNMSWSWLERWMATRLPETSSVESNVYDPFNSNHKVTVKTRFLDAAGEEKESCGSNEVPLHFDNYSINSQEKVSFKSPTSKTNFKARRTVSRRKTVPSYQCHEEQPKICKRESSSNSSKDVKEKQKQVGSRTEITFSTSKASHV
ncbi:protein IQ-DOMAIN 1 [Abrus precatorius]|uniref:Protein IQ-DOMAIN 1 n=1 Tax=Abrus precatorius TaxID=3816 RepID=A0A8B8MIH8_ABRPR|nr:protein IQ-DOMAIN 1 [Abrus precatorius]